VAPFALPQEARARLQALQAAAAQGEPGGVKRALEALSAEAIGPARRRAWEESARRYDYQGLEESVRRFMEQS
jgi:hypothetical protein